MPKHKMQQSSGIVPVPATGSAAEAWARDAGGKSLHCEAVCGPKLRVQTTFRGFPISPPLDFPVTADDIRGGKIVTLVASKIRQEFREDNVEFEDSYPLQAFDASVEVSPLADKVAQEVIAEETEIVARLEAMRTPFSAAPRRRPGVYMDDDGGAVMVLPNVQIHGDVAVFRWAPVDRVEEQARLLFDIMSINGGSTEEYGTDTQGITDDGKVTLCLTCGLCTGDDRVACLSCPRAYHRDCVPTNMNPVGEGWSCNDCDGTSTYEVLKHLLDPLLRQMLERDPNKAETLKDSMWVEKLDEVRPRLDVGAEVVVRGETTRVKSLNPVETEAGHRGDFSVTWGGGDIPIRYFKTV